MYIGNGNLSMKNVFTWNLPSKLTCPNSTELCRKSCYAVKAERPYRPNVLPSRMDNWNCSMKESFPEDMKAIIKGKTLTSKSFTGYFRIHESGDFYNQKYLDDWKLICSYFKRIKFLAYTKSFDLDFSNRPKNMEIVVSVWEDTNLSKVPKGFPISYSGMKGNKAIKCEGGREKCNKCGFKCWHLSKLNKNVWSLIH